MTPIFDIHIFVCTNQRTGSEKLSCGEAHGLELVAEFKKQLKGNPIQGRICLSNLTTNSVPFSSSLLHSTTPFNNSAYFDTICKPRPVP